MAHLRFLFFSLLLMSFLTSCGPRTLEDFHEEGKGLLRSLVKELQAIHSCDQLMTRTPQLDHLFNELVTLMIAAEQFHLKYPKKEEEWTLDHELNDQLRLELSRLYQLEGGGPLIEKIQAPALQRLEAFAKQGEKH